MSSRVIAITGASAGIGRATAIRLARDGASVAICARRRDRLDAVGAEIERAGGRAFPFVADVTQEVDMDVFVRRTVEEFGRLDVMMCNAGFGIYGAIDEIAPDQMKKLMEMTAKDPEWCELLRNGWLDVIKQRLDELVPLPPDK